MHPLLSPVPQNHHILDCFHVLHFHTYSSTIQILEPESCFKSYLHQPKDRGYKRLTLHSPSTFNSMEVQLSALHVSSERVHLVLWVPHPFILSVSKRLSKVELLHHLLSHSQVSHEHLHATTNIDKTI